MWQCEYGVHICKKHVKQIQNVSFSQPGHCISAPGRGVRYKAEVLRGLDTGYHYDRGGFRVISDGSKCQQHTCRTETGKMILPSGAGCTFSLYRWCTTIEILQCNNLNDDTNKPIEHKLGFLPATIQCRDESKKNDAWIFMETARRQVEGTHRADGKQYSKVYSKKTEHARLLSKGLSEKHFG